MGELRYDDRVAIVTAGGTGLGRSHALFLASRGAKLIINQLESNFSTAEAIVAEIEEKGGKAVAIPGRIGADETARELVRRAIETFGRVDIVINNAGSFPQQDRVWEAPGASLYEYMETHVYGGMQLVRAAWPHFVAQNYGRILFTGSANGTGWMKGPRGYEMDYAIAKCAIFAVVRQTAASGRAHNITANALMPWAFTPCVKTALGDSELGTWMAQNLLPAQVTAGIAPLLHEDCPVNGEAISSQGGRVARVFFAAARGYFNPELTPEDALDHWEQVMGSKAEDGVLLDVFEQTQASEEHLIGEMLSTGELPDLKWVSAQPVHDGKLASAED